jgi:hypothetical protein
MQNYTVTFFNDDDHYSGPSFSTIKEATDWIEDNWDTDPFILFRGGVVSIVDAYTEETLFVKNINQLVKLTKN